MIQDIGISFDNQYKDLKPIESDIGICVRDNNILASVKMGAIELPPVSLAKETGEYLFTLGDKRFFSVNMDSNSDYLFYSINSIRNLNPKETVFAAITAFHICKWYNSNKFCPECTKPMIHSENERAMVCSCGYISYPKISPAVIVAIINKDRILLTKHSRGYSAWALVAGYNEIGETIEQTVHREVFEETGLSVKNLRYYKSQPWGLSSSLLFGFFCELDGNDKITLQPTELQEARWFAPDEIDFRDDNISLTREMIELFKNSKF